MHVKPQVRAHTRIPVLAVVALTFLLGACGGGTTPTPTDNTDPLVHITSADASSTAAYVLTGFAVDNVDVTSLRYTLNGGSAQTLTLAGYSFSANLTLAPGNNEITVTASDAAGRSSSDSVTVNFATAPGAVTASASVAARGAAVTITGSNLGTAGSIDFGGVSATADSWTDSEIVVTIPANAPGGPQTVTVGTALGNSSFELFIGVEYQPGSIDGLVALGLPKGTAVLLGAGVYDQAGVFQVLDGLSLYGQGQGVTVLNVGAVPSNFIMVLTDPAGDVRLENLTLRADRIIVVPEEAVAWPLAAAGTYAAAGAGGSGLLVEALADLVADLSVDVQASPTGNSFSMVDVTIEDIEGGGLETLAQGTMTDVYLPSAIYLENVTYDGAESTAVLAASGDVVIRDSEFSLTAHGMVSLYGAVDILNTGLFGTPFPASTGFTSLVWARGSITIDESRFVSYVETLRIETLPVETVPDLLSSGQLSITNSEFETLDANPADVDDTGNLRIIARPGAALVSGNQFTVHRDLYIDGAAAAILVTDNTVTLGTNPADIPASRILLGNGMANHILPPAITFSNNTVTWLNQGNVTVEARNDFVIEGNSFTSGGGGVAVSAYQVAQNPDLDLTITNNTFTDFESALALTAYSTTAGHWDVTVTGNIFGFPIDAAGKVATLTDMVEATINANGNRWGTQTNTGILNGWIVELGGTTPGIMNITTVMP